MSEYLTISQLSRKYSIPVSTLRFYQRNGLLVPAMRDENNYGFYSINQLPTLELITFLRDLDIPIRTIEHIIKNGLDHAAIMKILSDQRDILRNEIRELTYKANKIDETEKLYRNVMASSWHPEELQVYTRHFETRWFIQHKLDHQLTGSGDEWHLQIRQYNAPILETANVSKSIYSMGAIVSLSSIKKGRGIDYHSTFAEQTACPEEPDNLRGFFINTKEPGEYLTIRYHDTSAGRTQAYRLLTDYIKSNNINTEDEIYDGIIDCYLPPVGSPRIYELNIKLL